MKATIQRLEEMLNSLANFISESNERDLSHKPSPDKWSKKEILGHLIDSALNNLQRFTEIQFVDQPYLIRPYQQVELVQANAYQEAEAPELVACWLALNRRIIKIMERQSEESLAYPIALGAGKVADLRFLMIDYVDHMQHHKLQIVA